jgi:hypothetical protein
MPDYLPAQDYTGAGANGAVFRHVFVRCTLPYRHIEAFVGNGMQWAREAS